MYGTTIGQDEEAASQTTDTANSQHWYAHFWRQEAGERALYRPATRPFDSSKEDVANGISRNKAIVEFAPALIDRMDNARKRQKDLYADPLAFYTTYHRLMDQFKPDESRDPTDATAGAVGWIIYLFRTSGDKPSWKMSRSEVPLAALLHDRDYLTRDYDTFKQKEGVPKYERRWIHLPANNMEWVDLLMHRTVETFMKKNQDIPQADAADAVDHVVRHILHPKRWTARQNDRAPQMLHARFMDSLAQQFTVASKSSAPEFATLSKRSFVFFMPYLSWERSTVAMYRNIVYAHARADAERLTIHDDGRIRVPSDLATANTATIPCCEREALLRNYLFTRTPLHLRRTLDQFYYTILSDTRHRDGDQVVERQAQKQAHWELRDRIDPCILMVDHLWLWILNQDTVITCFPKPWTSEEGLTGTDLFDRIQEHVVKRLTKNEVKPGKIRIGRLISESCARYLHKMSKIGRRFQFKRQFEDAVRKVKDDKSRILRDISGVLRADKPEYDDSFLDFTGEFRALGELLDIHDEVNIILNVIDEQIDVLTKLDRDLVRTRTDNKADPVVDWGLLTKLKSQKTSWEKILKKANQTRDEIKDMVEMKQQRATIRLAADTSVQSNSVMLFTFVTTLFLPLSTMAALFGINSSTFGQGTLPLQTIFAYIFPISALIISVTVWLAFNHPARKFLTLSLEILFARVKLYMPMGILDGSLQTLVDHLQDLQARRKEKRDIFVERKKKEQHEADEREKIRQEKRWQAQHPGQPLHRMSKATADGDDEFEEDPNVDVVENDGASTSAGTSVGAQD